MAIKCGQAGRRRSITTALLGTMAAQAAHAQCPQAWAEGFGDPGLGMNDGPTAWAVFDADGTGPQPGALHVGGWFATAGGVNVNHVARWTGAAWAALGTGISGANVLAMAAFDPDGGGPAPPGLFVGGDFFTAGGVAAARIARWDGQTWSPVAGGLLGGVVRALAVFNDGTGEQLYAGGDFQTSSGNSVPKVARWNGAAWSPVPNSFNSEVDCLYVYQGELYAGGMFSSPGNNIARRTAGGAWVPLGIGMDGHVVTMAGFDDDGFGPNPEALYVGGFFRHAGGVDVQYIARWDGANWSSVLGGVGGTPPPEAPFVRALLVHDDGGGPGLYVAGEFYNAGGAPANSVARYCAGGPGGAAFEALGGGIAGALPWVFSLASFDAGQGPALWAGGVFDSAGGHPSRCVARWGCSPCYPDCNGSGALTVADFGCFQGKYVLGDLYADCNASGSLTVADFGCFQGKYVLGCP
ncbi:MAG: hypothetical protein ACKVU4_06805 [Phycisphaerales bacterium]